MEDVFTLASYIESKVFLQISCPMFGQLKVEIVWAADFLTKRILLCVLRQNLNYWVFFLFEEPGRVFAFIEF